MSTSIESPAQAAPADPPPQPPSPAVRTARGVDKESLTKGLWPIALELSAAADQVRTALESERHLTMQRREAKMPGYDSESIAGYLNGLKDALLAMKRLQVASNDFKRWSKELAEAGIAQGLVEDPAVEAAKGGAL